MARDRSGASLRARMGGFARSVTVSLIVLISTAVLSLQILWSAPLEVIHPFCWS